MITLKTIVLFVILLSSIVSIHELGHLIAAKIFNVYCQEYSIGMGPKIFSKKGKETEFCIRLFPIGGFVAMAGDNDNALETSVDNSSIPFERTLLGVKKWKKIIIMLAGIFMNFILAIVIYSLIICSFGTYAKTSKPVVSSVVENMPASYCGIKEGDLINKVTFENGMSFKPNDYNELVTFLSSYDGNGEWLIELNRNGETIEVSLTPTYLVDEDRYVAGINFSNLATDYVDVNIFNCFKYGFEYTIFVTKITISSLATLFTSNGLENLSGPIGIYETVQEVSSYGLDYYLQLIAMLSINVGIFNALPLPIFDGGRVFLTLIELIIGKPLNKNVENIIMTISTFILLGLVLLVSFNDIFKLIGG